MQIHHIFCPYNSWYIVIKILFLEDVLLFALKCNNVLDGILVWVISIFGVILGWLKDVLKTWLESLLSILCCRLRMCFLETLLLIWDLLVFLIMWLRISIVKNFVFLTQLIRWDGMLLLMAVSLLNLPAKKAWGKAIWNTYFPTKVSFFIGIW